MTTTTAPGIGEYIDVVTAILTDINHVAADTDQPWQAARARRASMTARMHAAIDRAALAARTTAELAETSLNGTGHAIGRWTCPTCQTEHDAVCVDPETGTPWCQLCALGKET